MVGYLVWCAVGFVVGALAVYLILLSQIGKARAAEGRIAELKNLVEKHDSQFAHVRSELSAEKEARVEAQTLLQQRDKELQETKQFVDDAKDKLGDTFKALSRDVLDSSSKSFLELAKKSLEVVLQEAKGDIGKREQAVKALVTPLQEALARYEREVKEIENKREKAYGGLEQNLSSLATVQQELQKETANLVSALRRPEVRGHWGELTLKKVVELAGLSEQCDYTTQESVTTEDGYIRPDLVVHLPAGRNIVVDAKTPLDAYLTAMEARSDDERERALVQHAAQVRDHMNALAQKGYWNQFERAPEFVVMFIPGESFFAAALQHDSTLIDYGIRKRVVPATPTTLVALMWSIAYGWREEQIAKNARQISELAKEIHGRMGKLAKHLENIGKGLGKAVWAFNSAVGSLEQRLLPSVRRFKELGAATGEEIATIPPIDESPRAVQALEADAEGSESSNNGIV